MPDQEKVVKELEEAKELVYQAHFAGWGYVTTAIMDAIELIADRSQTEEENGICPYWHQQYGSTYCYGTKECEVCDCGGDKTKCNFYPEYRMHSKWIYDRPGKIRGHMG